MRYDCAHAVRIPATFVVEVVPKPWPVEGGVLAPAAQMVLQRQPAVRESVLQIVVPRSVPAALMRTPELLALLLECPRMSSLTLDCFFPEHLPKAPSPQSGTCANLRSLTIMLDIVPPLASACVLRILAHLPQLRVLHVGSSAGAAWAMPAQGRPPPRLPLESFTYSGLICGRSCARIIASSASTLRTLRIVDIAAVSEENLLLIIPAVMDVAPRLAELDFSFPYSGVLDEYAEPLVAALQHVRVLRVSARARATLWDVARHICWTLCRHLELRAVTSSGPAADIPQSILRGIQDAAGLRTLTLSGFGTPGPYNVTARHLAAQCRARRIQCFMLP